MHCKTIAHRAINMDIYCKSDEAAIYIGSFGPLAIQYFAYIACNIFSNIWIYIYQYGILCLDKNKEWANFGLSVVYSVDTTSFARIPTKYSNIYFILQ